MVDVAAVAHQLIAEGKQVIAACQPPDGLLPQRFADVVTVVADADGSPQVRVRQDWEQRLPAAELGSAVTEAIRSFLVNQRPSSEDALLLEPELSADRLNPSVDRLNLVMERLIEALDTTQRQLREVQAMKAEMPEPTITNRTEQVKIYRSGDSLTITIDPAWAHGRTGAAVSLEVDELIGEAMAMTLPEQPVDRLATDVRDIYDLLRSAL